MPAKPGWSISGDVRSDASGPLHGCHVPLGYSQFRAAAHQAPAPLRSRRTHEASHLLPTAVMVGGSMIHVK